MNLSTGKNKLNILILILMVIFFNGCSFKRIATNLISDVSNDFTTAFYQQNDPELAKEGGAAFLIALDGMIINNPDNTTLLSAGADAYAAYASAFFIEKSSDRAFLAYERALQYGKHAFNLHFNTNGQINLNTIDSILTDISDEDIPYIFSLANAWSGWIATHPDKMLAMADLTSVKHLMKIIVATRPDYRFGSAHIFFGIYYASQPVAVGGDLEKSKQHFEAAISYSGENALLPRVLCAQYYARMSFNEVLFEQILQDVLEEKTEYSPHLNLMNAIAKTKARKLLDLKSELF